LSAPTKEFDFLVNYKLSSPKIIKSSFNISVYFSGESLNENNIEMYVDGKLFSSYFIKRNSNNTFEFNERNISKGSHEIFFVARDNVGRQSVSSDKINIYYNKYEKDNSLNIVEDVSVPAKPVPNISKEGVAEESFKDEVIVEGINNIDQKNIVEDTKNEQSSEELIIDDILKEINEDKELETGALSENGDNQGDLKWNLIIFLGFLVAVIFWIIWVNREISKEESTESLSEEGKRRE
jgi:hypothetical protein